MTKPIKTNLSTEWNTSTHQEFYDYYAKISASKETLERFRNLRNAMLTVYAHLADKAPVDVLDVGCNSGSFSRIWAEMGFQVTGVDINKPLLQLAQQRAEDDDLEINFRVGSATELPYVDASFDVCCLPELLEHVEDWQGCLREAVRILRPGGLVYISTTNFLCPVQNEYQLPLYSWYPGFLKRRYERLAFTTRPELANFATFPAVHWFSYYGLRRFFRNLGLECLDRFDVAEIKGTQGLSGWIIWLVQRVPGIKFFAYVCSPATAIMAYKPDGTSR